MDDRVKLAAYIAAFKATGRRSLKGEMTFGQIAEETVEDVEDICSKGELGIRLMEFERDPDAS